MSSLPRLITVPRLEKCTASTVWRGESALLRTTFECASAPGPAKSGTLGEQLDRRFGIRAPVPRLILGDVDIAYRDERAFESIELRTTPAGWQRGTVDDAPADSPPVWVTFDVPYDQNGIFSADVPVAIRWDAVDERLALVFAPGQARHWYRPADNVAAGTSDGGRLAEVRLSAVEIVVPLLPEPSPSESCLYRTGCIRPVSPVADGGGWMT